MTEPRNSETSEVDPAVLAGEPDSVHQLEGSDDDLPVTAEGQDQRSEQERQADTQEWAGVDRIVDANPTVLGE